MSQQEIAKLAEEIKEWRFRGFDAFAVYDALAVLVLTPQTRQYLQQFDPKALEQAEAALKGGTF